MHNTKISQRRVPEIISQTSTFPIPSIFCSRHPPTNFFGRLWIVHPPFCQLNKEKTKHSIWKLPSHNQSPMTMRRLLHLTTSSTFTKTPVDFPVFTPSYILTHTIQFVHINMLCNIIFHIFCLNLHHIIHSLTTVTLMKFFRSYMTYDLIHRILS